MNRPEISRNNPKQFYSDSVAWSGLVFLRGATPGDRKQDLAGQTRQVLQTLDQLLSEGGTSKERLLSATVYMKDISQRDTMNALWREWIGEGNAPARATVGVAALGTPDCLIEISVIAAK